MTHLTIEPARTQEDVEHAFRIALASFDSASGMADYASYKTSLWHEDPSFAFENVILARTADDSICGVVRIVPRAVYRASVALSVAGISSVCLAPEERGKGRSVQLMEGALEECRRRGFDLAFLFARRAADHYYTRFGFWGVAAYCRLSLALDGVPGSSKITLAEPSAADIDIYASSYERCYARAFGRVARSRQYWEFALRRISSLGGTRFSTVRVGGAPVGYAAWSGSSIHELAIMDGVPVEHVLGALADALPDARARNVLVFEISPQHSLVQTAYGLDMTLSARECTYGGHMACILNARGLIDKLEVDEPKGGRRLSHLSHEQRFSHRDTCRLLGAWSPTDPSPSTAYALPYHMSVVDHF